MNKKIMIADIMMLIIFIGLRIYTDNELFSLISALICLFLIIDMLLIWSKR